MSKTRTTSIRSIIRQFERARGVHQAAKDRYQAIACMVPGTFVTVPELPGSHYFTPRELDMGAASYVSREGLIKGTPAFKAFQKRIDAYKAALNKLVLLRVEWELTSGLKEANDAVNDAYSTVQMGWDWILSRLAYSEDRPAIFRYLSNEDRLEPWRVRHAMLSASKAPTRRAAR